MPRRGGACDAGGGEEGAGLLALVFGQIDLRLAFPGLARDDAEGHADPVAHRAEDRPQPFRRAGGDARQRLEGQDDQRIARQHGQRDAEATMHARLAAPGFGIVEAGHVVMDEAGAVQQLDRGGGGGSQRRAVIAAGRRDGQRQARADARPLGEDRMPHRGREAGRGPGGLRQQDGIGQAGLDPRGDVHAHSPRRLAADSADARRPQTVSLICQT